MLKDIKNFTDTIFTGPSERIVSVSPRSENWTNSWEIYPVDSVSTFWTAGAWCLICQDHEIIMKISTFGTKWTVSNRDVRKARFLMGWGNVLSLKLILSPWFITDMCPTPGCYLPDGCPHGLARNKYGCITCECAGEYWVKCASVINRGYLTIIKVENTGIKK